MDSTEKKKVTFSWNLKVFKEPRAFIKVIQFVLSIFAFATTTSHGTSTSFSVTCINETKRMSFSYSYPYDLESVCFGLPICGGGGGNISSGGDATGSGSFCLLSGSEGASQFYVFVGVLVFLYCLAALVVYVVLDDMYKRNSRIIIADLIISIFLTLLWIISSSVWASGVADIKTYTDPTDGGIFGPGSKVVDCHKTENCSTDSLGNFASLNVSVIFGFLNFLVWLGNLWFIYKETPWFKIQAKPSAQPGTVSETDPQKV